MKAKEERTTCPTCRGAGTVSKIGEQLHLARIRCGVSRQALADSSLVTANTIRNIELGLVSPQNDTIRRLSIELKKLGSEPSF
jgi:transcriptional regulator with XRE-family HTH domain